MPRISFLQVLILILSIYILGALAVDTFFDLPEETSRLLQIFDFAICGVFFIDFCVQFYQAENKLQFMKWGWIDLIASIPMIDAFRIGRLLRLIRLIRIIKAFRTLKEFIDSFYADKARGTLNSGLIIVVLMLIFSSITILQVETTPDSNITTAGDSLWWAFVTITTVGYGDHFPVTLTGRIIASILMMTGIGMFGTFTAYVASWFVKE